MDAFEKTYTQSYRKNLKFKNKHSKNKHSHEKEVLS